MLSAPRLGFSRRLKLIMTHARAYWRSSHSLLEISDQGRHCNQDGDCHSSCHVENLCLRKDCPDDKSHDNARDQARNTEKHQLWETSFAFLIQPRLQVFATVGNRDTKCLAEPWSYQRQEQNRKLRLLPPVEVPQIQGIGDRGGIVLGARKPVDHRTVGAR